MLFDLLVPRILHSPRSSIPWFLLINLLHARRKVWPVYLLAKQVERNFLVAKKLSEGKWLKPPSHMEAWCSLLFSQLSLVLSGQPVTSKSRRFPFFKLLLGSTISDLMLMLYILNSQLSGKNLDGNWTGALMLFGLYFLQCSQVFRKFIFKYYLDSYPHLVLVGFLQWCHQFSLHWLFLLFCYDFSDLFVGPHDNPIHAWFSPKEEVYLQLHQLPWIALCGHKYWHLCLVHPYQGDFLLILVTNYLHIIIF